ncbi:MAG: NADPH-dependent FMN reductase [Candidatus Pacebacteria bacterium CG10_big_fil_rev_8_21_14_0_10_56_10]|nr:MAG: NADPH-dependent FMN reductase [Candidatus Pacebacteria bacterium CG10_big_fil_rev_8_21_14_0_10_56_10]
MLKTLIYSGSARQGNYTQHVAQFVLETAQRHDDVEAELVSPQTIGLDFSNEGMESEYPDLRRQVEAAEAYILVGPEYNHGYSGSLKYMLDLNLKQYIHKPVAMVGVSAGPFGGTRMIEALVNVVRELGMVVTFSDLNVSNVQQEVVDGKFQDPDKWRQRVDDMLSELVWMGKTLKHGRDNISSKFHQ